MVYIESLSEGVINSGPSEIEIPLENPEFLNLIDSLNERDRFEKLSELDNLSEGPSKDECAMTNINDLIVPYASISNKAGEAAKKISAEKQNNIVKGSVKPPNDIAKNPVDRQELPPQKRSKSQHEIQTNTHMSFNDLGNRLENKRNENPKNKHTKNYGHQRSNNEPIKAC